MGKMYVKRAKRKCGVRGCHNTVSFSVSRTREIGNTVVICAECAKMVTEAIPEYEKTAPKKQFLSAPPPLFGNVPKKETEEKKECNVMEPIERDGIFICPYCGKEYKTEKGAVTHMETCTEKEKDGDEE